MQTKIFHLAAGAKKATGAAVIIDVFRAFTVECFLTANGADIFAIGDKEIAYKMKELNKNAVLIGEREGIKLPGFDFGNSPSEIENVDFSGKTVFHTTSAGTQGVVNAKNADAVFVASLVNAKATAKHLLKCGFNTVSLVAMGLSGVTETDEDELCAEYIESVLKGDEIPLKTMKKRMNALKYSTGAKFFEEKNANVFPKRDFELCIQLNRFDFALKINQEKNGYHIERV